MSEPAEQGKKDLQEYRLDIEANKALVKRYIELWSTGNLALADEVLAPEDEDGPYCPSTNNLTHGHT